MIGLVQQINKISHPRGNFAHWQFSVLVRDLHTSVCLLRRWMVEDWESRRWGQRGPRYLVDHINSGGDTGHPSWPDHLSALACTWTGPTSGSNFPFSFVDHLTMCFPRHGQMSSHSWSTSGLCTSGKAPLRWLQLTTVRTAVPVRWAQTQHSARRDPLWGHSLISMVAQWSPCRKTVNETFDNSGFQKRLFSIFYEPHLVEQSFHTLGIMCFQCLFVNVHLQSSSGVTVVVH